MKAYTTLLALLFSFSTISTPLSFLGGDQHVLDDDLEVPGDNPLQFCQKDSNYSLTINKVDLNPNPPSPYVIRPGLLCRAVSADESAVARHLQ